ncbi:MAG: peptidoglycan bridge formation glycyltransferase FemA/FemB family protein [Alphaproteobacteria bacterium]|nr:peptidoglycan bridge formation glycyltransferase FemA/FemB family protein [Alphaproteobacteria bacterium]
MVYRVVELLHSEPHHPPDYIEHPPLAQSDYYADWQRSLGRRVRRFSIFEGVIEVAYVQFIVYDLSKHIKILNAPHGPIIKLPTEDLMHELYSIGTRVAEEEKCLFVRFDAVPFEPLFPYSHFIPEVPPYAREGSFMQPRSEALLTVPTHIEDLQKMKDKDTRYALRTAEKKGVTTKIITENYTKYFKLFFEMMKETATRNNFSLHTEAYTRYIFEHLHEYKDAILVIAEQTKEDALTPIAMGVFIPYGDTAHYCIGASRSVARDTSCGYAVIESAITYYHKKKYLYVNLGGISTQEYTVSSLIPLTRFKLGFGAVPIYYSPTYDIPLQKNLYRLYLLRKYIYAKIIKRE